ncbi:MAG: M48 family metalloprotease [Cytophagales bacterium]|nr:M48 family metalloprotease [Cytophagales bacterium]
MRRVIYYNIIIVAILIFFVSCKNIVNMVPAEFDKMIGQQFAAQSEMNPFGGEVLDRAKYAQSYKYLEKIKNHLLSSGKVKYKDDFEWNLKIIRNDSMLNAYCIAGGYIYVYTGIILFLDNEAQLAGVLAHEIAHADKRHTTRRIITSYGLGLAVYMILGTDFGILANITQELLGLSFSRADEAEADEAAVEYMYASPYDARSVGGFFKKMIDKHKDTKMPEFMSTHPSSEHRVDDIEKKWRDIGGKKGEYFAEEYKMLKNSVKN